MRARQHRCASILKPIHLMNPKHTWIWIMVAAVLGGVILISEQFRRKPAPGPIAMLPDFKAGIVASVQVRPAGALEDRKSVV